MNLAEYSARALAAHEARHAKADDLQFNSAGFWFDRALRKYLVEVRGHIVAELATMPEVEAFSAMHNNRIMGE